MSEKHTSICRLCIAHCGIVATVEDGRLSKVEGDPDNPLFKGYTCPKGRALPEFHNNPARLLHSQKKLPDGSHQSISSAQAIEEVSDRLQDIIAKYGPRSVAMYVGTPNVAYPTAAGMGNAWMRAIGSPMFFTSNTIDQPGKQIAMALHGKWLGGEPDFEKADAWLLIGVNPVISKAAGIPSQNPAQKLKEAANRGIKLIVIDPRLSETAKRAHIHLQPRPGEDATILAGLLHIIINEKLYDQDFVAENVAGFEELSAHVQPFTPDYVAERADVPRDKLIEAARIFAKAKCCNANSGTGSSFAMRCNLTEYLVMNLNTLCGHWQRAGEAVTRPNAMLPAYTPKAQPLAPFKGWGYGERLRVRGLTDAACGMPTAALADEILLPGEGQVKALICVGGNPLAAWPDQKKTLAAMEELELLVTLDVEMSNTARLADYVIATRQTLETPGMSQGGEMIKYFGTGIGYPCAYGQYSPRIVEPPKGSDLIEDWELFYEMACRMDLELLYVVYYGFSKYMEAPPVLIPINAQHRPTTEELYEKMCETARIPLDEVKQYPNGHVWDVEEIVQPRDADCEARLMVGNETMMAELHEVAAEDFQALQNTPDYPFRLIPRRQNNFVNSSGRGLASLNRGQQWNPAYMHPEDLAQLQLKPGDEVSIATIDDAIPAIVEADDSIRRGLIAMSHAFGGLPDEDDRYRELGSNTGRLVRTDRDYDPITGMPRMGNIPVAVIS